ncbi:TPA: ABC transporter substrate-binding protein [Stenotrophomonas maltophilia]|jgi:polar amino acid transport system substrate-binding protein|uniref:ABC transporter substrate-binding protein n=1 Tax=Stenotrophomonas TaxID=40323 RepID=UPI0007F00616|nr:MULTISPECIES: ABC transporter substrate-binding protein [Stenotrophomonas]MBH1592238.1 ABC transporter substrate-binding protein [Stenotrophomonas maltophilia]MDH2021857.1 ABC transporter substrate-binding protein [Stenotrophomonas sp. GD03680]OBU48983.1 ABC transporter substrate-binding protein [Stenotrophomonas maltophilia]HEL3748874.1 ABC transporter substrate-binding protein [Stenotrophomonas maltophilia]HEL7629317.1 ABC transporter substrate-binding protein [Stenotrophomonas maltophili
MSPATSRRPSRSTLLVIAVLVIGIAGIVYSRARQAPEAVPAATSSLAGAGAPALRGTVDPKAQALVPADFRFVTPGTLTVATHPGQLPLADYGADSKEVIGIEPDIARLVADALGLKLVVVPVAWADWPLGLESGKYDAVLSNVTVTEERKKKFDFSSYRYDLLGIYTRTDGPIQKIEKPADVAGLKVVVGASTNQDQILRQWDAQNIAAGLEPVQYQYFDDSVVGRLAVITGRADVSFEPNATGAYSARDGKVRRVGLFPGGWPNAAAISVTTRKGSGLADAVTQALNTQIGSGTYAQALARWNVTEEAVPQSQTNPPGLPDL